MSDVTGFLIGIGLAICVSGVVVVYLRPYLRKVLIDLCGTEERADFWTAFSNVTLALVPLICALFYRPVSGERISTFFNVTAQLQWALVGLIGSVVILGAVISKFIPEASAPREGES